MIEKALLLLALAAATVQGTADPRCNSPKTPDLVACAEGQWQAAEADLQKITAVARRMWKDDAAALASMDKSDQAWRAFVKADCQSAYDATGPGQSEIQFAFCRAGLTRTRAHDLWERYVQGSDSKVPEPPSPCAADK